MTTANEYGCPESVYQTMQNGLLYLPMLDAVKRLGPQRVRYVGPPPSRGSESAEMQPTAWALDGLRVTVNALRAAAGLPLANHWSE